MAQDPNNIGRPQAVMPGQSAPPRPMAAPIPGQMPNGNGANGPMVPGARPMAPMPGQMPNGANGNGANGLRMPGGQVPEAETEVVEKLSLEEVYIDELCRKVMENGASD